MKLRFVLWMLGQLLKRAWRRQPEFRDAVAAKGPLHFGIGLEDLSVARHYHLHADGVEAGEGLPISTQLELRFRDADAAVAFLKRPSPRHFREALMSHRLRVVGDVARLDTLQALLRYLRR
ncbi:hypothetical protein [Larsenimonas rhizosphaerae]|uniref:hypothetical protein n=1 Tax=Larsenimonas rhizosphaerae TaxID=2944682 RepID=UPI0020332223|nr:hypothetical protein [Larsenimonas rhizosphaerae]MCM2131228.1 hypothetical protein [Larsenimonas rhizosphaerae]